MTIADDRLETNHIHQMLFDLAGRADHQIETVTVGTLRKAFAELLALRQSSPPDGQTADGWIEWKGGECPVNPEVLVYYKTDDGTADGWEHTGTAWRAGGLQWSWNDTPPRGRIIAYRVIPTPSSETKAS